LAAGSQERQTLKCSCWAI